VHGRLLDVSGGGFRVAHSCAALRAGQQVQFRYKDTAGMARVMWNRILPERVETGFVIL
jgi:hypothetical protein